MEREGVTISKLNKSSIGKEREREKTYDITGRARHHNSSVRPYTVLLWIRRLHLKSKKNKIKKIVISQKIKNYLQ